MIDNSIPYYPLTMYKTDTCDYPRFVLPDEYEFVFYKKGDEVKWAEIEMDVGQFTCIQKALDCFTKDFVHEQNLNLEERMLFVKDKNGQYIATGTLWNGRWLGKEYQRIHWIAVKNTYAGRGIAKALLTRLMALYNQLEYNGFLYLTTGTRNYRAVSMYRKFGFLEYKGPRSLSDELSDAQFAEQAEKAVSMINERLALGENKRTS